MNMHAAVEGRITPDDVRAQVSRILASDPFVRCRRMQRFLEFIVEETLAGYGDNLGEYAIGVAVFDRGEDFEPALDPIVRNDARRLRAKLGEYYDLSPRDRVTIDIPKGGYVPVFLPLRSTKLASNGHCRIAVLPFEVVANVPEGSMVGRAMCMSLTANLTLIDGIEAVAHGYVAELPLREATYDLRLSHVISGSVLTSKGRCRVTVNLIHTPDGTQLWAREFDFEIGELLTRQPEITGSVLRAVSLRLCAASAHLAVAA